MPVTATFNIFWEQVWLRSEIEEEDPRWAAGIGKRVLEFVLRLDARGQDDKSHLKVTLWEMRKEPAKAPVGFGSRHRTGDFLIESKGLLKLFFHSCDLLVYLGSQTYVLETQLLLYHLYFCNYFFFLLDFKVFLWKCQAVSGWRVCSSSGHNFKGETLMPLLWR